jgi:hypothetical protein
VNTSATPEIETAVWSPSYVCFDGYSTRSYSAALVVFQLLMHEIWVWENEMADGDQAAETPGLGSQFECDTPEKIPHESELLPCHYFDFFYGTAEGGLIATLLGQLRMRVDDATDRFQQTTQAVFGHRQLFGYGSFTGLLNRSKYRSKYRPKYRPTGLFDAVHNTIMKHSTKKSECSGIDELFRTMAASWSPEDPRQAQTCIAVAATVQDRFPSGRKVVYTSVGDRNMLRTVRMGSNRERAISDSSNLTICQVLSAATAIPRFFPPFEMSTFTEPPRIRDGSFTAFTNGQAIFLSIDSAAHGNFETDNKYAHVTLSPRTRSDVDTNHESAFGASKFRAIYDETINSVNDNELFKEVLRRAAKDLVRRRRARQAMGGPRWDVFVGNTVKGDHGAGNGRS